MKKFLFTLAALLMAGSAFATEDYLYIKDFEVTKDQLGKEIEIPVAAHFEGRVSAMQFAINLPEGMEVVEYWEGEDATIDYYTNTGRARTVTAGFTSNDNVNYIVITSATTQGYYQVDGTWTSYGAIKWEPGEYDELLVLVVDVDQNFQGGTVNVVTEPACGQDPRGNRCTENQKNYIDNTITVEKDEEPKVFDGTATVENTENVFTLTYTSNDENATVVVTVNGEPVEVNFENGVATYEAEKATEPGEYSVTVAMTVTPSEEYTGEAVSDNATYTYTVMGESTKPVINWGETEAGFNITVEPATNVEIYVDGVLVDNGVVTRDYDEHVVRVVATNKDGEYYNVATTEETKTLTAKEKPAFEGTAAVQFDGNVATLNYTSNDPEATVVVKVNGTEVNLAFVDGVATYEVNETDVPGTYTVTVELTVTPSDNYVGQAAYDSDTYTYTVEEPKEKTESPNIGVTYGDPESEEPVHQAVVKIDGSEEGATYQYSFDGETWYNYTEPVAVVEDGTYTVYGRAIVEGKDYSEPVSVTFVVTPTTGLDELVNGKAVAGVRYFNMAGQEMQEANGITIVVTTYTDGTTSAVKVMK